MNLRKVITEVITSLEGEGIRYALIGGFAMAMRGVQRATMDIDLLLMLEDLERAETIFFKVGYVKIFRSENVSHYQSPEWQWGRIDVLHAFRGPSLSMLDRADLLEVEPELTVRVAQIEDIIGLKVQALTNDPERAEGDWSDIRLLVQAAAQQQQLLDWELIRDYLELFALGAERAKLKGLYESSFR